MGDVKIVLRAPASQYQSNAPMRVVIDEVEQEVMPGQKRVVKEGFVVEWAVETHTVQVDTPAHRVRYNGVDVVVEEKIASAKSCGLCGENSLDRRGSLQSPRQCVYKSIKSIMQSYRVEDSECNSRLPTTDRNNLRSQKSMCSSRHTVKHQQLKRQKEQHENSKSMPTCTLLMRSASLRSRYQSVPPMLLPGLLSPGKWSLSANLLGTEMSRNG